MTRDEFEERIQEGAERVNQMWRNAYPDGRDPERIDRMMDWFARAWKKYPDMRLGQLFQNIVGNTDAFHIEDDEMEHLIATYTVAPIHLEPEDRNL